MRRLLIGVTCGALLFIVATSLPTDSWATSTTASGVTVRVSTSPSHLTVGEVVTFAVLVRGPGVLDGAQIDYGDGVGQGANVGLVRCGQTKQIDHVSYLHHTYKTPGTYRFFDVVHFIGPEPFCMALKVVGSATIVVKKASAG